MSGHPARGFVALTAALFVLAACGDLQDDAADDPDRTAADGGATPTAIAEPSLSPDEEAAQQGESDIPHYEFPSGNQEIYMMDAGGESQQRLTDDQNQYMHPVWSPDGSQIAAIVTREVNQPGRTIVVMDADGSNLREVTDQVGQGPIAWSPDGATIAFSTAGNPHVGHSEIHLIDVDGANLRPLTDQTLLDENERYMDPVAPSWSPDGSTIVFSAMMLEHENTGNAVVELFMVDLEGNGIPRQITSSPEIQKSNPVWQPGGESITFAGTDIENYETALYTIGISGENQELLHPETEHARDPAWSPDGERIAFTRELFGSQDIRVLNTASGEIEPLTDDDHSNFNPAWSPSGDQIAFVADRDPRVAQPCSYGEIYGLAPPEPFEDLAWISHQVFTATIVEEHEPDWMEPDLERGAGRSTECLQIMTDYTVEIETQFRGQPADTLRMRVRGGEVGQYEQTFEPSPDLSEGDRLLLFLDQAPPSEFLPDAYMLHMQRSWPIAEDDTLQVSEDIEPPESVDLARVEERIREALGRAPEASPSRVVPEAEAPIHVGISEELQAFGEPCSYGVDFDLEETFPFETLAWISSQVVTGTVIERHDPVFADPHWFSHCLEIVTEYTLNIETRYRGEIADTLRIRVPGGAIGEFVAEIGNTPSWEAGDRVLAFLFDAPESELLPDAYGVHGQGAWGIDDDQRITANSHLDPFETAELAEVEDRIRTSLAGDPPDGFDPWIVPLDDAPVVE